MDSTSLLSSSSSLDLLAVAALFLELRELHPPPAITNFLVTDQQIVLRESWFLTSADETQKNFFHKKIFKTQFPTKSETTDLLLRSTHLWCWRWKLPEAPSPDGAATLQEQQFRRQRDGHSCFSSSFGRQTLTLIPKALLVSSPMGFSRVSRGSITVLVSRVSPNPGITGSVATLGHCSLWWFRTAGSPLVNIYTI